MKIKSLLLLIPVMSCIQLMAQKSLSNKDFNLKFGYPYEIPKGYIDLGYFGDAETGFVQLSYKQKQNLSIQIFDKNLKVVKENSIDITVFPIDFTNEAFYHLGNKYYWFFSTFEKKDEKETFWVQEIDLIGGKLIGKARQLIQNNRLEGDLAVTGFYQFALINKYTIERSYDYSKILITYRPQHKEKNEKINKEEVGFCVLDENLNVLSNKIIQMPYSEEKMDNEDYDVDSKGNAYLLAKVYNDKRKESKNDLPNYYYEIFRLVAGHSELNMIKLNMQTYFIPFLLITELANHEVMVGGYYSKEANSASSDGVFLAKIDEAGNASNFGKGYFEFPVEVLKQFLSERQQRRMERKDSKDDVEANFLRLRNILSTSNGGIQVFGEVYYIKVNRDSRGKESSKTYYYEDILALSVDAAGNLQWVKKIPKRQRGGGSSIFTGIQKSTRGSMSFETFYDGSNTFIFYTDNINNLNLPVDKKPDYHVDGAGGYLVYAKIDANGNMTKDNLFDYKKEEVRFEPAQFQHLGENAMANRAYKGRISRVVLLVKKE